MTFNKEPVRLVFDPSSPAAQVELLRHDAGFEPPRGAEDRVWQALAGALATGGATARAPGKTAKTTTATKLVALALGLGALAAVVAIGARFVAAPPPPRPLPSREPIPQVPPPPPLSPPVTTVPPRPDVPPPWPEAAPQTHPASRPARSKRPPTAQAGVETTLIEEARRALRGGDPARALTLLETCRRLFPEGPLEREREWLTIQSLVGTVRGRDAKDRAAAFLKKFPDDPHARDLRAMGLAPKESR